jgi:3',5'-cyclic AMP phosphodiesterase CpdA
MSLNFRFAVASDLHVALPHTVWQHPNRIHLVEVGIPALEVVLERLSRLELDFLLLPGDLTQHGEPENHRWLADRLAQLPYPVYVIPGNHDIPVIDRDQQSIAAAEFPHFYRAFGYDDPSRHYYSQEILPGVRLIALNSNTFDANDKQVGRMDQEQLEWLQETLARSVDEYVIVMIHHNVLEHLPEQSKQGLGKRYILENAPELVAILKSAKVNLVFTGHLHIQDVAYQDGIYDITTGSLVSYPHPYRVFQFQTDRYGRHWLRMDSDRVEAVPGWDDLAGFSRKLMGDRSEPYMRQLLTQYPLHLSEEEANQFAPSLRYFWAAVAEGDASFSFAHFPEPARQYFEAFGAKAAIDNQALLPLGDRRSRQYRQVPGNQVMPEVMPEVLSIG